MQTFYKMKLESCGYPKGCDTEEGKKAYVDAVLEKEGIRLDPDKIESNPGRKSVAKTSLNNLWGMCLIPINSAEQEIILTISGKFGQRTGLPERSLINDEDEFFKLMFDETVEIYEVLVLTETHVLVTWKKKEAYAKAPSFTSSVHAAFTSMWGRLKLYGLLEKLQERVIYFDTVSPT